MPARTIAIGDIHGCSTAFRKLVEAVELRPDDTLVTLGDYVDRGLDSRGVLEFLIELTNRCRLIPLLGNHEEMMWAACEGRFELRYWRECGGQATLDSYGKQGVLELVPRCHLEFVRRCHVWFETETHLFVHANYRADLPMRQQDGKTLRWLSLRAHMPPRHMSGKTAIVGHTPQPDGEILDVGYLKCLDTGCCAGGWLSALEVDSGQVWQVDERGALRIVAGF
ncbi:MAG TPA: metallophosphoesterase family protein [Pirellulales bacterium]|nr:metallophosphoesterase family protein [Pirellulales bacterium]